MLPIYSNIAMVQINHNLNGPRVSCTQACVTHIGEHTHVGFLDSTSVYLHMQACFFYTCACNLFVWIMQLCSQLASYLPISLSYNATVLVNLFIPYRALAAHQGVEDKIAKEVESTSLILQLATSYLTEAFLLPEVTICYTRCSGKSHH